MEMDIKHDDVNKRCSAIVGVHNRIKWGFFKFVPFKILYSNICSSDWVYSYTEICPDDLPLYNGEAIDDS